MVDIWYMDSEFCEQCDALLDDLGICPECGYDGVDYDEDDDEYDGWGSDWDVPLEEIGLP